MTEVGSCLFSVARVWALTIFVLAGCTTQLAVLSDQDELSKLQEQQTVDGNSVIPPPEGVIYYLPATEFQIATSWTLEACGGKLDSPFAKFTVSVDIQESFVADRTMPYLIDYPKLESALKHSDLSLTLRPNGTLASVNALITDKSGEVVASLLKTAGNVARLIVGAPGVAAFQDSPCIDLADALTARKTLARQTKTLRKAIDAIVARETAYRCRQNGDQNQNGRTCPENSSVGECRSHHNLHTTEQLDAGRNRREFRDPHERRGNEKNSLPKISSTQRKSAVVDAREELRAGVSPFATLSPRGGASEGGLVDSEHNPGDHVIYRTPAPANLAVFLAGPESASDSSVLLKKMIVRLPQAGIHMALPLLNPAFDQTNLVAKFAEDGSLAEFQFVTNAQATEIAKAIAASSEDCLRDRGHHRRP